MKGKIFSINHHLSNADYDVICSPETWFNVTVNSNELTLNTTYDFFRFDRSQQTNGASTTFKFYYQQMRISNTHTLFLFLKKESRKKYQIIEAQPINPLSQKSSINTLPKSFLIILNLQFPNTNMASSKAPRYPSPQKLLILM